MEKDNGPDARQSGEARRIPTGRILLSEERLRLLADGWEGNYRSLRTMDGLALGETEPATLFIWEDQP